MSLDFPARRARMEYVCMGCGHRFGVEQRAALKQKGPGCDLLVMTATPIPRTLALTVYGDLDCSYLHTRPQSTAPTTTKLLKPSSIAKAYDAVRSEVKAGHQAYIVCPLVGVKRGKHSGQDEVCGKSARPGICPSMRKGTWPSGSEAA